MEKSMGFSSPVSRPIGFAAALLAMSLCFGAQGQEAMPSPQPSPSATTPAGQKGTGRRAAKTPATPAISEQHKLPPDSTTKHTLDLPGRSLSFTATAGSIRLVDDKREPQADIAYTSYQLDGTDHA